MENTEKRKDKSHIESALQKFEAQKDAYFQTMEKVHDLLSQNLASKTDSPIRRPQSQRAATGSNTPKDQTARAVASDIRLNRNVTDLSATAPSLFSKGTGEESDEEHSDDQLYAQDPLTTESYDEEGLRQHLISTPWDEYGWEILKDILTNGMINNASHGREHTLFSTSKGPAEDRSHLSGHQVWDVGSDGAPLAVENFGLENEHSKAMAIWHCLKEVNPLSKDRKAVGRITIMRELR